MSDVLSLNNMASLWEVIKSATPVETAVVATILASLLMLYVSLTK
jgi:hypothetical protein